MSLTAGNRACTTGLSKRIFDAWQAEAAIAQTAPPLAEEDLATSQDAIKAIAYAIATAVVAEITVNAVVDIGGDLYNVS